MPPGKRPTSYSQEDDKKHFPYPQGLFGRKGKPSGRVPGQNKAKSAAVQRAIVKARASGKAGRKIQEDEAGFNPQTMGNKRYKVGSPAYKALVEAGEARVQETPHGPKHKLGGKIPSGSIQRRIERQKAKSKTRGGGGGESY